MKPNLVSQVENSQTGKKVRTVTKPSYTIPLKPENLAVIRNAMADVMRSGTARRSFAGAPYQAAGKTGTAQVYSLKGAKYKASAIAARLSDHALFMAYEQYDHRKIAVALICEDGVWGVNRVEPLARTALASRCSTTR